MLGMEFNNQNRCFGMSGGVDQEDYTRKETLVAVAPTHEPSQLYVGGSAQGIYPTRKSYGMRTGELNVIVSGTGGKSIFVGEDNEG